MPCWIMNARGILLIIQWFPNPIRKLNHLGIHLNHTDSWVHPTLLIRKVHGSASNSVLAVLLILIIVFPPLLSTSDARKPQKR